MSVNQLSKSYIEAALAGDASIKKVATGTDYGFNAHNFAEKLELKLSSEGFFSKEGASNPQLWLFGKDTIGDVLREHNRDLIKLAGSTEEVKVGSSTVVLKNSAEEDIKLSSSNGGSIDVKTLFTVSFQGLMKEIGTSMTSELKLARYFPTKNQYTEEVQWSMINPYTGKTADYVLGLDPESVNPVGSRMLSYQAPFYREQMVFNEAELLFWRNLGSGDLGVRGALERISLNMEKLLVRLHNRQNTLIADGLYNNYFTWRNQQYLFGIPTTNRVTPVYGPWAWRDNPTSDWNYNSASNPLWDMNQWLNNNPLFRKYRSMIPTLHMNPTTWGAFIQNPNVNSWVSFALANGELVGTGEKSYSKGYFVKTFIPGMENIEIVIEDAAWIPDENVTYDANGYYANSTADWYLQDGYIFFGVNPGPEYGGPLGSFQQTIALQNGGMADPQPGRFIVLNDNINPGTLGGPAKPYVGMVAGVNGGLAIPRANDCLSASVFITLNPS